ncbi:MAG: glycosidase, partial [Thermoplasmata archaeon]
VTPYYIMEPKEIYEIFGDRPHTIFPCGAQKLDDKILLSYGAGDSVLAFGEVDVEELLSLLNI